MQEIQLSCHTITWERNDIDRAFSEIAKLGFAGVEVFGLHRFYEKKAEFKDSLSRRGLKLSAGYYGGSLIDKEYISLEVRKLRQLAEFLKEMETKYIVIGAGRIRPQGIQEKDYYILAETLNEVGKIALQNGIKACYHPHSGTLSEKPDKIDMICELVDPEFVYLAPDTAHLQLCKYDPVEFFQKYLHRIVYIHFKDLRNREFVELGQGQVNFPAIYDVLKENQYSGWITVELDATRRGFRDGPRERARMNKEYLSKELKLE